jgi:hypothetical protein
MAHGARQKGSIAAMRAACFFNQAHAMLSSTEIAPPSIDLIYFLRDHREIAKIR